MSGCHDYRQQIAESVDKRQLHNLESLNLLYSETSLNGTNIMSEIDRCLVVVHRSSETSTNQSDVIIQSDDRFLNLVTVACGRF